MPQDGTVTPPATLADGTSASAAPTDAGQKPQRPDYVPEKFWDAEKGEVRVESLLKSYGELEKKLGGGSQQPQGLSINPDSPPAIPEDASIEQVLETVGISQQEITQQFNEHGKLTDDQYAKFRRIGIPKAVVDLHLQMQSQLAKAAIEDIRSKAEERVGGAEQLANLMQWGKQSLSPQELEWYNAQATNPATALHAVEWLAAKHAEAVGAGKARPLFDGGGGGGGGGLKPFETAHEMATAINDPKYAPTINGFPNPNYDAAYRSSVIARLKITDTDKLR